jgi:hypothetical protein
MFELVKIIDPHARKARRTFEEAEATRREETSRLAETVFQMRKGAVYPEATGTLRITWGQAIGIGRVPYAARLGQWFELAKRPGKPQLPARFQQSYGSLNLQATLTFASDVDVANGHAGPTVDQNGNLVGILFASNFKHVANAYWYLQEGSRAIHMSSAGVLEVLRKVYGVNRIINELQLVTADGHKSQM